MTNIDEMPAGREMDELIAKEIFGWHTSKTQHGLWNPKGHDSIHYSCDEPDEVPHYSTGVTDAWDIVDKMDTLFRLACVRQEVIAVFTARVGKVTLNYRSMAGTAPLAICRAALNVILSEAK